MGPESLEEPDSHVCSPFVLFTTAAAVPAAVPCADASRVIWDFCSSCSRVALACWGDSGNGTRAVHLGFARFLLFVTLACTVTMKTPLFGLDAALISIRSQLIYSLHLLTIYGRGNMKSLLMGSNSSFLERLSSKSLQLGLILP